MLYLYILFQGDTQYHIVVKTGEEKYAGTDNEVKLEIVGDKAKSEKHNLNKWWRDDHERGSTFEMKIKDQDIGNFEYVLIRDRTTILG